MAMFLTPESAPHHIRMCGDGRIALFCSAAWDATAVEGVAGTTYDPTNHVTTSFQKCLTGYRPVDFCGMKWIDNVEVCSTTGNTLARGGVDPATTRTGQFKARFVPSGQYLVLVMVGGGNADPLTMRKEQEMNNQASALVTATLRLILYGFGTYRGHGSAQT